MSQPINTNSTPAPVLAGQPEALPRRPHPDSPLGGSFAEGMIRLLRHHEPELLEHEAVAITLIAQTLVRRDTKRSPAERDEMVNAAVIYILRLASSPYP